MPFTTRSPRQASRGARDTQASCPSWNSPIIQKYPGACFFILTGLLSQFSSNAVRERVLQQLEDALHLTVIALLSLLNCLLSYPIPQHIPVTNTACRCCCAYIPMLVSLCVLPGRMGRTSTSFAAGVEPQQDQRQAVSTGNALQLRCA